MQNDVKLGICRAMSKINQLSHREFSKNQIEEYADTILELFPNINPQEISDLMTLFFKDEVEFNPSRGERNFTGYLSQRRKIQSTKKIQSFGPFEI